MKRLLISVSITAAFGLAGCGGGDKLEDIQTSTPVEKPYARIVFDPANSDLNVPNDLLMIPDGSFFDFTLETDTGETFDPSNPLDAVSALDGWSTQHPFAINVDLPAGVDIDATTLVPGAIRMFEATQALEGTSATCQGIADAVGAPGIPCEIGAELQFGVDFVALYAGDGSGAITVAPLKPLKSAQGYMLVVTEALKDTDGRAVRGSTSWDLVRQDPDVNPLSSADQIQLQGLVNLLVTSLSGEGIDREDVSYAAYFSTQSAGTVVNTVKQLQIGSFAQAFATVLAQTGDPIAAGQAGGQYLPAIVATEAAISDAFTALAPSILGQETLSQLAAMGLDSCSGLLAGTQSADPVIAGTATQVFSQVGSFCAASVKQGSINLPYYLSTTDPLGDWWKAACTNGAMLQLLGEQVPGIIAAGAVGPNNALCQAASGGQLYDLNLAAAAGIDDPRHLTKVSPIPAPRGRNVDNAATAYNEVGTETLNVQITVPDESIVAAISAATGGAVAPISKPDAGWPVVILQHGITSKKEDTLAITGALSLAGFATVAIDHPLHGSRGFTIDGQIINASGGFGGSVTDYLNLSNLLATRDNNRQSIVDTLGLRLGLKAVVDTTDGTVDLDGNRVAFIGQSLGSITGIGTVATANTSLPGDLAAFNDMFKFESAVFNVPGGATSGFLLESASFSPLIKASLLASASTDFQQFLGQYAATNGVPVEDALVPAYLQFYAALTAEQRAPVDATFASFAFAAQTVTDAGDPNNYAAQVAASTPVLLQEVVGGGVNDDGGTALSDQVIPNTTSLPLAGTEPLISIMGLPSVATTTQGSGAVRFTSGAHSSLLSPSPSAATTAEMQRQAATFVATGGQTILVSDPSVVLN